jgi:hypothetical protein
MSPRTRIAVHLAVIGIGMISAAARPAVAASSWSTAPPTAGDRPASAASAITATLRSEPSTQPRHARPRPHPHARPRPRPRPAATTRVHPVARPLAHPRTQHRATVAVPPTRSSAITVATGPTGWAALDSAIARIPGYRPGTARWVVSSRYGHWGTADWYHDTLYISPSVPSGYLYDVAVHEWSHELSVLDYGADVSAAVSAMNRYFGGSGLVGAERAADCMAILQGATWTHYTSCSSSRWRSGAAALLHGHRLP